MPFDQMQMAPEELIYNARWTALLDHVHSGLVLHEQVREAIDAYGKKAQPETKPEADKRFDQVRARVAALSAHFAEVIGVVTVWAEGLKPLMEACRLCLKSRDLE